MNPLHLADGLARLFPDDPPSGRVSGLERIRRRAESAAVHRYRLERECARVPFVRPDPDLEAVVVDRRARRSEAAAPVLPLVGPWECVERWGVPTWIRRRQAYGTRQPRWRDDDARPAAKVTARGDTLRQWATLWGASVHQDCGGGWSSHETAEAAMAAADERLRAAGFQLWETL